MCVEDTAAASKNTLKEKKKIAPGKRKGLSLKREIIKCSGSCSEYKHGPISLSDTTTQLLLMNTLVKDPTLLVLAAFVCCAVGMIHGATQAVNVI